jgi:hypothetical protein
MKHVVRAGNTYWWNDTPIMDVHLALEILLKESAVIGRPTYLHDCQYEKVSHKWEIVEYWYREGSSGGDRGGWNYFQIDARIAEQLVAEKLVIPKEEGAHPCIIKIPYQLLVSDKGRRVYNEYRESMKRKALGMLRPGVHTDLTGETRSRGMDREPWRCGELFFAFDMPLGGQCHVFPGSERIVLVDEAGKPIAA